MAGVGAVQALEHWIAFCFGRPARDGWQPSPRYRLVAALVLVLAGAAIVGNVAGDRGEVAGAAMFVMWFAGVWFIVSGRNARASDFATRHPYLDATWSIPIAAFLTFIVLPKSWPLTASLPIGLSYIALIFANAWRRTRKRRKTAAPRTA